MTSNYSLTVEVFKEWEGLRKITCFLLVLVTLSCGFGLVPVTIHTHTFIVAVFILIAGVFSERCLVTALEAAATAPDKVLQKNWHYEAILNLILTIICAVLFLIVVWLLTL